MSELESVVEVIWSTSSICYMTLESSCPGQWPASRWFFEGCQWLTGEHQLRSPHNTNPEFFPFVLQNSQISYSSSLTNLLILKCSCKKFHLSTHRDELCPSTRSELPMPSSAELPH